MGEKIIIIILINNDEYVFISRVVEIYTSYQLEFEKSSTLIVNIKLYFLLERSVQLLSELKINK